MIAFDEIITVRVCVKCGRGFPSWTRMSSPIDAQQVWWTLEAEGPRCDGRVLEVDRRSWIDALNFNAALNGDLDVKAES